MIVTKSGLIHVDKLNKLAWASGAYERLRDSGDVTSLYLYRRTHLAKPKGDHDNERKKERLFQ